MAEVILLLHAGAGFHSLKKEASYKTLCEAACSKGLETIRRGGSLLDAAVDVIKVLEDSELTNAGKGSSLTIDGQVECDASVMSSDGYFGAVGALTNFQNPVEVAHHVLLRQKVPSVDGRVPPCCLVGEGARQFALECGLHEINNSSLISDCAVKRFEKYSKIVQKHQKRTTLVFGQSDSRKRAATDMTEEEPTPTPVVKRTYHSHQVDSTDAASGGECCHAMSQQLLDTVGVICANRTGMAVASSSGGIALKRRGRLGQAAMIGSGVWTSDDSAAASTGCGEQLMRTLLARHAVLNLTNHSIQSGQQNAAQEAVQCLERTLRQDFLNSRAVKQNEQKFGGLITISRSACGSLFDLTWGHTTRSMVVSYASTSSPHQTPTSIVSRLDQIAAAPTSTAAMASCHVNIRCDGVRITL